MDTPVNITGDLPVQPAKTGTKRPPMPRIQSLDMLRGGVHAEQQAARPLNKFMTGHTR